MNKHYCKMYKEDGSILFEGMATFDEMDRIRREAYKGE